MIILAWFLLLCFVVFLGWALVASIRDGGCGGCLAAGVVTLILLLLLIFAVRWAVETVTKTG